MPVQRCLRCLEVMIVRVLHEIFPLKNRRDSSFAFSRVCEDEQSWLQPTLLLGEILRVVATIAK